MTDDETRRGWTAELKRLRQADHNTLAGWPDMEIVKAALYEYAVEGAGESWSMEALLRVEAELERLRGENERLREELADYKRVEQSEAAKKWPHWIPLFKYDRTMRENERLKAELERLRGENA